MHSRTERRTDSGWDDKDASGKDERADDEAVSQM